MAGWRRRPFLVERLQNTPLHPIVERGRQRFAGRVGTRCWLKAL